MPGKDSNLERGFDRTLGAQIVLKRPEQAMVGLICSGVARWVSVKIYGKLSWCGKARENRWGPERAWGFLI